MLKLLPLLKLLSEQKGSDLYLTAHAPPIVKIEGKHRPVGKDNLTVQVVQDLIFSVMTDEQIEAFNEEWELDFATEASGLGRFRINVFMQRGRVAAVFRRIPTEIPQLDDLNMPPALKELAMHKRGLVLMVGATGSGKSTTLAAMISHRNHQATGHILTIEDPIEFVHLNKKSIVNQRELGVDTRSMPRALRSAVREAPDLVLMGESRDPESMGVCLQLAGTGHLVMSTLHAGNTYQAFQRVVKMFPPDLREQLYMDLSMNLRAMLSQRLVMGKSGKRVAAIEVLIITPHIAELIMSGKFEEIQDVMIESQHPDIQTFDQSLAKLFKDGVIEREEALSQSDSRANLEAILDFS